MRFLVELPLCDGGHARDEHPRVLVINRFDVAAASL